MQTMISRSRSGVALGVVALLTWMECQSAVQPPPVVRSKLDEDSFRVRLLMVEMVQTDLGLTADQIGKLRDFAKTSEARSREFLAKSREILPPSQSFPPEEFEARKQKFRALSEELKSEGKELRTKALAMLTPHQSERLKQIQIQVTVPAALARPEIIKALDISEEQRAKIRVLRDDMDRKQLAEWPDLHDLNPAKRREMVTEFMKRSNEAQVQATNRILDVLTPEQRRKFQELQGKKIDLSRLHDALIPEDGEF